MPYYLLTSLSAGCYRTIVTYLSCRNSVSLISCLLFVAVLGHVSELQAEASSEPRYSVNKMMVDSLLHTTPTDIESQVQIITLIVPQLASLPAPDATTATLIGSIYHDVKPYFQHNQDALQNLISSLTATFTGGITCNASKCEISSGQLSLYLTTWSALASCTVATGCMDVFIKDITALSDLTTWGKSAESIAAYWDHINSVILQEQYANPGVLSLSCVTCTPFP